MDLVAVLWVSILLIVILGVTIFFLIKTIIGRSYEKENREETKTETDQKKRVEEKC